MRHLPPLNQLKAFEACARHMSFAKAADEIGVTATAVSHQIRLLELRVGRTLFQRRPRPIALTEDGVRLFPVIRNALDSMAEGVAALSLGKANAALRVTTTNAFAARWLAPRLPLWRAAHPKSRVHVIGTDALVSLEAGEADVAIRYCRTAPPGGRLLMRDRFHVVASPKLIGSKRLKAGRRRLLAYPLVEAGWPAGDPNAPTWSLWMDRAKIEERDRPEPTLVFHEEAHAIEAVLAGQGVGICSDVLVGAELASGALSVMSDVSLPGFGFFIICRDERAQAADARAFTGWLTDVARQPASAG